MPLQYDDEPGSWGRASEGWPETPYTIGKWLLCTKAEVVPYGSYVLMNFKDGGTIRVETEALKRKLETAYKGMFVDCRGLLLAYEFQDDAKWA